MAEGARRSVSNSIAPFMVAQFDIYFQISSDGAVSLFASLPYGDKRPDDEERQDRDAEAQRQVFGRDIFKG